jgi:hypothetical protein
VHQFLKFRYQAMKKIIRCLLFSSFFLLVLTTASAQSKGRKNEKTQKLDLKPKEKKAEKHGRKAKYEKTGNRERPPNKEQVAKHKQRTSEKKQKAHEKKLSANKAYKKAEKQKRKEETNDKNY